LVERSNLGEFETPQIYAEDVYDSLYSRCSNIVSNLALAQDDAIEVMGDDPAQANQIMFKALEEAYAKIATSKGPAAPHVSLAIIEGFKVANAYQAKLPMSHIKNHVGVDMGYALFIQKLYKLIFQAYDNLDLKNFSNYKRVCVRGRYCFNQAINPHSLFSDEYYDGIRKLAVGFLNILVDSAEASGRDSVELALTAAVADSAAEILNQSVYRRDFACAVVDLWNIKVRASVNSCGSRNGIPLYRVVNHIRHAVAGVYASLTNGGYGQRRCRARR